MMLLQYYRLRILPKTGVCQKKTVNDRFPAAFKGNEVNYMYSSQQNLHLINKTLTMSVASGSAIPLKCRYFFQAFSSYICLPIV